MSNDHSPEPRIEPGWDALHQAVRHAYEAGPALALVEQVDTETGIFRVFDPSTRTTFRRQTFRVAEFVADLARAIPVDRGEGPGFVAFIDKGHRYLALPVGEPGVEPPSQLPLIWGVIEFVDGRAVGMPIDVDGWDARIYSLAPVDEND